MTGGFFTWFIQYVFIQGGRIEKGEIKNMLKLLPGVFV